MSATKTIATLLSCLLFGPAAAGDAEVTAAARPAGPGAYWYVSLGDFEGAEIDSLESSDEGGFGLGAGYGRYVRKDLALEFEASVSSTDYELPSELAASSADSLTLDTTGILVNVKLFRTLGRMRPFAGVGLGVGMTALSVYDDSYYYATEPLEDEFSVLSQILLGADFRLKKRHHLGMSYRRLIAFDDFDWLGEDVDPGGDSFLLAYRYEF